MAFITMKVWKNTTPGLHAVAAAVRAVPENN